jgi:predicted permease
MDTLWQDSRYAFRMMRRAPGFTAVAILSLALGIGANTAIFSLINALMLRPLPVREPQRLVELLALYPGDPRLNHFGWKYYEQFRDHSQAFSNLLAVSPSRFQVTADGVEAEIVNGDYVIGTFFSALGIEPAFGRLIGPQDDRLGASPAVAVVSWSYWQNRFNGDRAILGKQIVMDGVPATVVGVTPREFSGLQVGIRTDLWVPVAMEPLIQKPSRRATGELLVHVIGRLKPGVSIERAQAEMRVLDRSRVEEIANARNDPLWRQVRLDVAPAGAGLSQLREQFAAPLLVLMVVVGLLLLIASTNIASLLLARGAARQREMAVRVSLGAGRVRLVRQVLTESLLLSFAGGALGVLVAYVGGDALVRIISSGRPMPGWPAKLDIDAHPDLTVLLFTAGVAMLTGLLFGLAPAWHAFASAPALSLRGTGVALETRSRRLFGKSLVVAQVAVSVVLLSATGLFIRHLSNLRNVDLGFTRDSLLLVSLDPARSGYERIQLSRLYQQLLGQLEAIPGVRSATLSAMTPISGAAGSLFATVEGFQERAEARRRLRLNSVAPRYFETMGTPLIAGRDFQFEDEGRPRVAIVNQAMARYYFGDGTPIGKHVTFDGQSQPYEIVGVVADAKYSSLHEAAPRMLYSNAFQDGRGTPNQLMLRTNVAPLALVGNVRHAVRNVLRTVAIAKVTTMTDQIDASIVPERLIATLSAFFGGLGALLAAIGLYGLLAYTVARRTNEIGIRMALGATRRDVTAMVLKSALGLVCVGLLVGAPLAASGKRLAARVVESGGAPTAENRVTLPLDAASPIVFASAAMIAMALVAAYVPVRRATRIEPVQALRQE